MAVVRTGPRDVEGTSRDIGPSGSGVDGLSAVGRLSALRVGELVGDVAAGAGPIERRPATPDELARLDVAEHVKGAETRQGPAMHVLRPAAARMAESRMRGNERMLAGKREPHTEPAARSAPQVTRPERAPGVGSAGDTGSIAGPTGLPDRPTAQEEEPMVTATTVCTTLCAP